MKSRLLFSLKYFFFWILIFIVQKVLFMFFNYHESFELNFSEWFMVLYKGLALDFSAAAYISAIPALVIMGGFAAGGSFVKQFINIYTFLVLFVVLYLGVVDMDLYSYWGYKLDISPLLYVKTPGEAIASVKITEILLLLLILAILYFFFLKVYLRYFKPSGIDFSERWWVNVTAGVLVLFLIALPARGGVGIVPVNLSRVYFHQNPFANHSAINVLWNTIYSITERNKLNTRINYMENEEAGEIFRLTMTQEGRSHREIVKKDANVLFIILESFSNKIIGSLGGEPGITPGLDSLAKEAVVFRNFYASGDRSDKGMVAIFSGFPAQPTTSVINYPAKSENLPFLFDHFSDKGYHTAFYYGGDLNFANFKAYFSRQSLDRLVTIEDFSGNIPRQEWGIPDEYLFGKIYDDLEKQTPPFFYACFTLSSHEPFDVPMQEVFGHSNRDELSKNAFFYTDRSLKNFIEKAKKAAWWENTLVVIVADHGSRSPGNTSNHTQEKFRIPMFWTGGAVLKDTVIEKYGSQTDIPATLLSQYNISHKEFKYSRDLLDDEAASMAFYAFNNGFGFGNESGFTIFDNDFHREIYSEGDSPEMQKKGKAFFQVISEDFASK